jgi:hypothetical protein
MLIALRPCNLDFEVVSFKVDNSGNVKETARPAGFMYSLTMKKLRSRTPSERTPPSLTSA